MTKLTFRYEYDRSFFDQKFPRDDFGRLSIAVETDRFAGRGGFWVQWQDVKEFGEALATYPIKPDSPIEAQWGFNMQEGDDLILRVEIAPASKRGDLIVRIEVADDREPQQRVRASFMTNYLQLETFRAEIAGLMNAEIGEAVLTGS